MELETTFYVISIIYMTLMIGLIIALLTAVLVIKAKINKVHDMVDDRVNQAKSLAGKVSVGLNILKQFVKR